ncbi:MAG TPA: hypothetical protein VLL30_25185, partial [Reyranella sp.]|nr:hypothetical protein [Reyranella sp.]
TRATISRENERRARPLSQAAEARVSGMAKTSPPAPRAFKADARNAAETLKFLRNALPCSPVWASDIDIGGPSFSTCAPLRAKRLPRSRPPRRLTGAIK